MFTIASDSPTIEASKATSQSGLRVDQDQQDKYDRIIELLLVGGYFRARISTLSPFDKVVGGMAWAISASNVDVDVDVIFQENSNIKQQISIAESIIHALLKMKCRIPVQPQQIRGLDFINIFPVIQWLVKKVIETRQETGDLIRQFSEAQFNKYFLMPQDKEFELRKEPATNFVSTVEERYSPKRKFRRTHIVSKKNEEERVQSAILEYGYHKRSAADSKPNKDKETKTEEEIAQEEETTRLNQLMGKLSSLGDTDQALSTDTLNEILTLHAEELRKAKERYEVDKASGPSDTTGKGIGGFEAHRRLVNQMNHQMVLQKRNLEEAVEKLKEQNKQLVAVQNKLQAKLNENTALEDKLLQFDEIEKKAENQKYLKALRELVALNESLKLQEAQFKAHCKKQMAEMKEKIEQIRQGTTPAGTSEEGDDIDERERIKLIEETYEKNSR